MPVSMKKNPSLSLSPLTNVLFQKKKNTRDAGVKLILYRNQNVMEYIKCGKRWEVDTLMLKDGRIRIKGFIPIGLGYRFSIECPGGCNKDSKWKNNICWISILKDED